MLTTRLTKGRKIKLILSVLVYYVLFQVCHTFVLRQLRSSQGLFDKNLLWKIHIAPCCLLDPLASVVVTHKMNSQFIYLVEMFTNNGFDGEFKNKVKPKDPVEKTSANSFRKLLKDFASDTSFGGVSKATLSDGHIRRFIWCLISATCYILTIYMCYLLVQTYLEKPIKTNVDISHEKVTKTDPSPP